MRDPGAVGIDLVEQRSGNLEAALDALWSGLGAVDRGIAETS